MSCDATQPETRNQKGECMENITRRGFLGRSAMASGALAGVGALAQAATTDAPPVNSAGLQAASFFNGAAALSRPLVPESQLGFRIGLARTRTANYPLDSMDFIMMDLERPDGCSRHAHWCTGDLTGRLLEFLSCAQGVDGQSDPRLPLLFERILKQRRPSGLFGRYAQSSPDNVNPEDDPLNGANRLFCGLIRYHELTGDARAIESAEGVARRLLSVQDAWRERVRGCAGRMIEAWVTEPMARLYGITKEPRYLDFVGMINEHLGDCTAGCHAHGAMSVLRGLQVAALVTGDHSWNEKPEANRRMIIQQRLEMPDGCTPEAFPRSRRNEGCSIADWLMLNLNAGLLTGDDAAYDKAERVLWNALALNQFITGGFGQRGFAPNGYGVVPLEEAWWCCVHHAGMAMSDYARHAVTFRDGAIRVNSLIPGQYALPLPGGHEAHVMIVTRYPSAADATIEARNVPAGMAVKLRVPASIRVPTVTETRNADRVRITLQGRLGHRIEECHPGVMLTYGPLVLTASTYFWDQPGAKDPAAAAVPPGYIPESVPPGTPALKVGSLADADGFLQLRGAPLPTWSYFDEGPGARCWVEGSAVNVPVKFANGEVRELRFAPLCYNTSNLTLCETPLVFHSVEA
jgi:hypothetical protein